MKTENREKAAQLAARTYKVEVRKDETTKGEIVFLATNPELPGCMGQGKTISDAMQDLDQARIDFLESLLDDGLPVPTPYSNSNTTNILVSNIFGEICYDESTKCNEVLTFEVAYK